MYRRTSLSILAVVVWLFCAHDVVAGVRCYKYEYAPNLVRAVQKLLKEQGFYRGAIDGEYGPKTKSAIQSFQERNKISFRNTELRYSNSGQLEERTLKAMFGEDAPTGVTVLRNPSHAPENWWADTCK